MKDLFLKYIFGVLIATNTFILPIIIVLIGLKGEISMIPDITILHATLFMFFFPFNGNSRNYILNTEDEVLINGILTFRTVIYLPLVIISYLTASYIIQIPKITLILLIFIGSFSWILEIYITDCEKKKSYKKVISITFLYFISINFLLFTDITYQTINLFCLILILFIFPVILTVLLKNISILSFYTFKKVFFDKIFNQIGGTTVISISSFVVKLIILLLLPKALAATIFLGYTLGDRKSVV